MAFDPSSDYLQFDGLEPFSLVQGTNSPVTVNNCLRGKLSFSDRTTWGAIGLGTSPGDMTISCWTPELSGKTPGEGDRLIDAANVTYIVQGLDVSKLPGRYRLIVRKAVGNT
jgi:hypothetical protein